VFFRENEGGDGGGGWRKVAKGVAEGWRPATGASTTGEAAHGLRNDQRLGLKPPGKCSSRSVVLAVVVSVAVDVDVAACRCCREGESWSWS
jgi:hypothetical protein